MHVHLSRVKLDEREVLRIGGDLTEQHLLLASCLDPKEPRYLYRMESPNVAIVQTQKPADWGLLPGNCKGEQRKIELDVPRGAEFNFRLRGNPCRQKCGTKNRAPLRTEEERRQWLMRQAEKHGFSVKGLRVTLERPVKSSSKRMRLTPVLFDGRLRVDDPGKLHAAMRGGIGPGKHCGFGLLSIAPVRTNRK